MENIILSEHSDIRANLSSSEAPLSKESTPNHHDPGMPLELEFEKHREETEQMNRAMMNIFEDLSAERAGNVDTQKSMINILEDLRDEIRAKNKFLALLSHELRNPLAPITSTLEYMKIVSGKNKIFQGSIETIEHQFGVLTRLLRDLLDVARISSDKLRLNLEEVSLQTIIGHAIDSTRPFLQTAKHSLSLSMPERPIRFKADPLRFEQIIVNLLSNAIKYTEPGGSIGIVVKEARSETTIMIWDTGIGIDPQMLPRIFNLFTQQDQPAVRFGGGLGVGLALVRSLVKLHGGKVFASSGGIGKGSTFTVCVPMNVSPEQLVVMRDVI